jgi:hypothetical protein
MYLYICICIHIYIKKYIFIYTYIYIYKYLYLGITLRQLHDRVLGPAMGWVRYTYIYIYIPESILLVCNLTYLFTLNEFIYTYIYMHIIYFYKFFNMFIFYCYNIKGIIMDISLLTQKMDLNSVQMIVEL